MSTESPTKIRILLVDDHALFREGLVRLLEAEPDFELAAQCASVKEAFEALCEQLRVQPRGIHGEHTETAGGVWDISNKERLGVSEVECAQILYNAVTRLIDEEKKLGG